MAYENVNVKLLKSALNELDNISSSKLKSLINSVSYNDWQSEIEKNVVEVLKKILKEYEAIQKQLKEYKTATTYIEEYKRIIKENQNYTDKIYSCNCALEKTDSDDDFSLNYYRNKLENYRSKLNSNRNTALALIKKIENIVS